MKNIIISILFLALITSSGTAQIKFIEDNEKGTVTLLDGQDVALTYCFGDQLKKGVDPKHTRSCFIHPLFSLDGDVLTDNFPADHLHHHGLFWTWPVVLTRSQKTQTWHPANPSLRQHFSRWLKREVTDETGAATLRVENLWRLDDKEIVAKEITTIQVHPADNLCRIIDLEIKILAVGGPLVLQGTPEGNKGYGGLCLRGAELLKGAVLTTDKGLLEKDSTNVPFRWADLSTEKLGIAIFVSPDHPDFPTTWLIRNSYAGILNPSWPGLKPATLKPEEPVTLRYRLYIHRGDATAGEVREAYEGYIKINQ